VKKGQILVYGTGVDPKTGATMDVHSVGSIIARTWYEKKVEIKDNANLEKIKADITQKVYSQLLLDIPPNSKIVNKNINFIKDEDDKLFVNVIIECEEEIGQEIKIGGTMVE
jgi:hypothetical protein